MNERKDLLSIGTFAAYEAATDWIQKNVYEMIQFPREVLYTGPGLDAKWEIV